ncbi:hypothetical protein [Snodgrassella communis]|uniref:hypothetical protein n=1 Tax=Snodgrassella communis TaxID=2946699 RepID=UPI001EF6EF91|nr:hypothetical protein [Snodgrassella communis]WMY91357.1 hypothetical protein PYG29_07935 [Snodgrassella communis]
MAIGDKMKIFKYTILSFLLFSASYTNANQNKTTTNLNFADFSVETKAKIKNANFAYEYLVKVYGCGGGAICGKIRNLLSNTVIALPNAYLIEDENGENGFSIEYYLDSSLIIISGVLADPDVSKSKEGYKRRYYNLINNKLKLIQVENSHYDGGLD